MPQIFTNAASVNKVVSYNSGTQWKASFLTSDGGGEKSFGIDNKNAGKRLKEVLDLLDASNRKWPWGGGLTSDSDFEVNYTIKKDNVLLIPVTTIIIGSVDLTVQAYQAAIKELKPKTYEAVSTNRNELKDSFSSKLKDYNLIWEHLPGDRRYTIVGHATVTDGDTINVKISQVGNSLVGYSQYDVGNTVVVRLSGVNTAETAKTSSEASLDADTRNAIIAREYKISEEGAYALGAEGKKATTNMISIAGGSVIVDIDVANNKPKTDTYGRTLGMVYKSVYDTTHVADPMTADDWYININKTLVASASSFTYVDSKGNEKPIPIAKVDAPYQWSLNDTKFDTSTWAHTVALGHYEALQEIEEADAKAQEETKKIIDAEMEKFRYTNEKTYKDVYDYEIQPGDTLESIVDEFTKRGDIVTKEILIGSNNLRPDENGKYTLTPGDVITIPVITRNESDSTTELGQGLDDVIDNKTDFFPPMDDRRPLETEYHMRIGDVQFVIPPLSINVNTTSTISKVKTLRTKSSMITRVGASEQTISLQLYFHELESINGYKVKLSNGSIYYMDGLRSLIAQFKKTPFLPIENEYINNVLGIYDVILVDLNASTVPGFPHSIAVTLTLAEFNHEAYMPHVEFLDQQINYPMMRWYYQQTMKKTDALSRSYLAPIEGRLTNDFHFTIANENDLASRQDAVKEIRMLQTIAEFEADTAEGKNLLGRMEADGRVAEEALGQYKRYNALKKEMGKKFPSVFSPTTDTYKKIYGENFKIYQSNGFFMPKEFSDRPVNTSDNYFILKVTAESNRSMIPTNLLVNSNFINNTEQNKYILKASQPEIEYVNKIFAGLKVAKTEQSAYKLNYQKIKEKANSTEGQVLMDNYYIDGLTITAMNVQYENSFSKLQTQMGDHPTYQYLGSQDPYIQLTMETSDRQAIADVKNLISTSDYYSKKYRLGISSGFIGFENQLSRMFGVTTVMIENCNVRTVPGFPNRFEITLVMCGFNKTQKRSESLEGFSATASKAKDDRYVTKNVQGNDPIVIERKMKDLEVYPDLELPTYKELNSALQYINAGITTYHNPTGALYVDPDFYISTNWTYRDYMKGNYVEDMLSRDKDAGLMHIQDATGFQGQMRVNSQQIFEADKENMALFVSQDEKTAAARNQNTKFSIPEMSDVPAMDSSLTPDTTGDADTYGPRPTQDSNVKTWVKDAMNIYAAPTQNEVLTWVGGNTDFDMGRQAQAQGSSIYKSFLGKNPTTLEFYQEVYKLVDELFQGYFFDERKSASSVVKETLTYASIEDYAKGFYMWLKHSGDPRFGKISSIETGKVKYADLNQTKGTFTRERLANYLKAMFTVESGWKQFVTKGSKTIPKKNPTSSAVGLGQIMLYWHALSISDAKRLSWDWRYNLRNGVTQFRNHLKAAFKSDNIQIRSRPYDWAWRSYEHGSIPKGQPLKSTYFEMCADRFNQYNAKEKRFASPGVPIDTSIYNFVNGSSSTATALIQNDRQKIIDSILELETKGAARNPDMHDPKKVEKMSIEELKRLYKAAVMTIGANEESLPKGSVDAENAAQEAYDNLGIYSEYQATVKAIEANKLKYEDTPQASFRGMFTDIMEYDQRGRMLRAFPTFQMFIIDEGRWMASYRLWDNLYGFNAIESIDVHKSRKIAADTAVIKMTNIYSNLTSRRLEENYGDWSYSIWDNLVWGEPSQQIFDARSQIQTGMLLQTGARIHLRMGYGADASSLPVMFNGTITELDTDDLVTIIAQGDGLELTNMISADPDETNDGGILSKILEPRDFLAKLLTSKGNWFKDAINYVSDGKFFKDNPLGIQHFGNPVKVPATNAAPGAIFGWHTDGSEYGEAVQNIYSSNGANTFSQYTYQDGSSIGMEWDTYGFIPTWKGDEMDVEMKLYGQSTWDVAQTLAYVSPDYIAAVLPFEMRSTLFFGKPYYKVAYKYDASYDWNETLQLWERTVTSEKRKPYQQFHFYNSMTDIISNKIKASEEGVFTNCIVRPATGKQSLLQQVDFDIRYDKQKTKVIETNLVDGNGVLPDFWNVEQQANYYAQSALRDSMKDMYKGTLTVLGDPSLKPHDMCHMVDSVHEMNGPFLVKDVTHSFSMEEGFVSYISPDCVVVVDDMASIAHTTWLTSVGIGAGSFILGKYLAARTMRKLLSANMLKSSMAWSEEALGKAMLKLTSILPHDKGDADYAKFKELIKQYYDKGSTVNKAKVLSEMEDVVQKMKGKISGINADTKLKKLGKINKKGLVSISEGIIKNLGKGKGALNFLRVGSFLAGGVTLGVSVLAGMALSFVVSTWQEAYRRNKKAKQCVMILPMKYQGREFTAGINGYAGSVVGSKPGKMDQFYMGAGYGGAGGWTKTLGQTLNYFLDPGDENLFDEKRTFGTVDYYINTTEIASQMMPEEE